jgi:hypothetical protein
VTAALENSVQAGNVVVQAAMSLDGFIAGPAHSMDRVWGCPVAHRLTW